MDLCFSKTLVNGTIQYEQVLKLLLNFKFGANITASSARPASLLGTAVNP